MKIILNKEKCIDCGSCVAVCPDLFEIGKDSKTHLKGVQENDQKEEVEVDNLGCGKEAVDICAVQAIEIKE